MKRRISTKYLGFVTVCLALLFSTNATVVTGPSSAIVKIGVNHEFACMLEITDLIGIWAEEDGSATGVTIFTGPGKFSSDLKHNNFYQIGSLPVYNMEIRNVEVGDEGTYVCRTNDNDGISAVLTVEAVVTLVTLMCNGDCLSTDSTVTLTEGVACDCSCQAIGGYPDSLVIGWNFGSPGSLQVINSTKGPSGTYDFTSSIIITASSSDPDIISCTVNGYDVSIIDESSPLLTDPLSWVVQYAPKECKLKLDEVDGCETVSLTCECDSEPGVPLNGYTFFNNSYIIEDGTSNTITQTVELDVMNSFTCQAFNDIGPGGQSTPAEPHQCSSITPSPTPPENNDGQGCTETTNTGLIVACVVEAVIILFSVLFFVFVIRKHVPLLHKSRKPVALGEEDNPNTAYTDLHDLRDTTGLNKGHREISERNVKTISVLTGQGIVQYKKASVVTPAGDNEVVVKTLSDDTSAKLVRVYHSEVQKALLLPVNVNVVNIIGWCNRVPNYVISELANGSLFTHIRENYGEHAIHTYGNTNQKKFQVPERGSVEILPAIALQVARGLKFLAEYEFLHPGLRSKKVLLDSSGRCKLYEFVSSENAKEWISSTWIKGEPYQWMSPEYLFLEKISPAGDVWSFGVLMWEIFSFGTQPHSGLERDVVERHMRDKKRLSMPQNCPGAIWQLMIACWEHTPDTRPTIGEVAFKLSQMSNDDKDYVQI